LFRFSCLRAMNGWCSAEHVRTPRAVPLCGSRVHFEFTAAVTRDI
jgi:hypothetical protein